MADLSLDGITKRFGDLVAVDDVSVDVRDGELLCLLGPSGCGKSTTLRTIGGLETPTEGRVVLDGEDVTDVPAYRRDTSTVFQNWALFPYKTVLENVAFGLKMAGVDADEREQRAREMLETMRIAEYADSDPGELSGGQQQRVALARSLVTDPSVLLLDEPLSNLDKRLRERMQIELTDLHERLDVTFVHVTHDQDEAFTIADRIGIMNDGRLVQIGEPREVYDDPTNRFVEEFLGDTNFVTATVDEPAAPTVDTELGASVSLSDVAAGARVDAGDRVTLSLRPEDLTLVPANETTDGGVATTDSRLAVAGTIDSILYRGSVVRYVVGVGDAPVFTERTVGEGEEFDEGQSVTLRWDPTEPLAFDADGNRLGGG